MLSNIQELKLTLSVSEAELFGADGSEGKSWRGGLKTADEECDFDPGKKKKDAPARRRT